MPEQFCNSIFNYKRNHTKEVKIGNLHVGGDNPIPPQSMTNTKTDDVEATIKQGIAIYEAGGLAVRITVPTMKDVGHFKEIKEGLRAKGYTFPLIADVHFSAKVANAVAAIADKVRINPGNFVDKKKSFEKIDYTEEEYNEELENIKSNFIPYINECKKHGTTTRIGTNHGSLSDRIMSKYGDTPLGMAESTMEFLRICKETDYNEVVVSLKASNTLVLVQATRLLVAMMKEENIAYPLHIGVTEAGDGEDGRIKSAVGCGALLADGIGDTIRVSLTEEPEMEIPVAKKIVALFDNHHTHKLIEEVQNNFSPFEYTKRKTIEVDNVGGKHVPVVISSFSEKEGDAVKIEADYCFFTDISNIEVFNHSKSIVPYEEFVKYHEKEQSIYPLFSPAELSKHALRSGEINFLKICFDDLSDELLEQLKQERKLVLIANSKNINYIGQIRALVYKLENSGIKLPVILHFESQHADVIKAAALTGSLFLDGLVDGLWLDFDASMKLDTETAFSVLQACRVRMSKTEYISCPGCGRTLFGLQETTKIIKEKTGHLKNLKIGIMGCIVNGPGEMADADYGYVGSGVGLISLYKGKTPVKKNIPEKDAVEELIKLIKLNKDWVKHD